MVPPCVKPFLLSADCIMNYASDVTGTFIHGNVHLKMLELLKVFKRFSFPLLKTYYVFLGNGEGHTPQLNMGWQVRTGHTQKEESICAGKSSSRAARVSQPITWASSATPAEVPSCAAHVRWNNHAGGRTGSERRALLSRFKMPPVPFTLWFSRAPPP